VFVVVVAAAVVLFAGLLLDGGLALSAKTRAIGVAQEAARAGAQEIDLAAARAGGPLRLLPDRARAAAAGHLTSAGCAGTVDVAGNTVTVVVTVTRPTQLLGLAGLDSLTVTGRGSAHPVRGITAPEPEAGA
jgi:hypothetical protein